MSNSTEGVTTPQEQDSSSNTLLNESIKEELLHSVPSLKHVEPEVKNVLPTANEIAQEKVLHDIENKRVSLSKVDTVEKSVLPTQQDILEEKNLQQKI